jgi:signal transduction histidine kinase
MALAVCEESGLAGMQTSSSHPGRPIRILLAFLAWTLVGVIFALPRFSQAAPWTVVLRTSLGDWWSWGVLVPAIIAVDNRLPIAMEKPALRFAAHAVLGLVMTVAYVYVDAVLLALLGVGPWSDIIATGPVRSVIHGGFLWSVLVYLLIVGGWRSIRYSREYLSAELRLERLERSFSEARLNTLRMQLDPHFLFNALNTISAQVVSEPQMARKMIEHLGDLLRLSLEPDRRMQVRLADEIVMLSHYVAIQKIRFGDKLDVVIDVPERERRAMVPSLILQPLVENAVRHGLSSRVEGGTVTVTARSAGDLLTIVVEDNGVGLPDEWTEPVGGLGLAVTRERIAMLHDEPDAGLEIGRRAGGGTSVKVTLPQTSGKEFA